MDRSTGLKLFFLFVVIIALIVLGLTANPLALIGRKPVTGGNDLMDLQDALENLAFFIKSDVVVHMNNWLAFDSPVRDLFTNDKPTEAYKMANSYLMVGKKTNLDITGRGMKFTTRMVTDTYEKIKVAMAGLREAVINRGNRNDGSWQAEMACNAAIRKYSVEISSAIKLLESNIVGIKDYIANPGNIINSKPQQLPQPQPQPQQLPRPQSQQLPQPQLQPQQLPRPQSQQLPQPQPPQPQQLPQQSQPQQPQQQQPLPGSIRSITSGTVVNKPALAKTEQRQEMPEEYDDASGQYTPLWHKLYRVLRGDYTPEFVDKVRFVICHRLKTRVGANIPPMTREIASKLGTVPVTTQLESILHGIMDNQRIPKNRSALDRWMTMITHGTRPYYNLISAGEITNIEEVFGAVMREL